MDYDASIADLVSAEKDLESQSTSGDLLPVFVMPEAKRNAKKVSLIIIATERQHFPKIMS